MQQNKRAFFNDKLSEYIDKSKELCETLKSLGIRKKTLISNFNGVESNIKLKFDEKTIVNIFKDFSNLAKSLLIKLPNAPNKYNLESVFQYSKFITEKPFHLSDPSEEEVLKIKQNIDISKAAGFRTNHLTNLWLSFDA